MRETKNYLNTGSIVPAEHKYFTEKRAEPGKLSELQQLYEGQASQDLSFNK